MQINHDKLPNNNIRDIIPTDIHKTRELKIAYWRRLIDEWLASGLNKQEFSKRKGISHNSLSYWRNIFLKESKIKKSRHTLDSTKKPSAAFSQLVVTLPPQPKEVSSLQSSSIEIVTPSDYKIRLPISVSADILKSVFSALEGSHAQAIK
jgi:hypothetical protein